jgi:hypothetical protein
MADRHKEPGEAQALAAELLLEHENSSITMQEMFLKYLVMEVFVRMLRTKGHSNDDILKMFQEMDKRHVDSK